MELLGVCVLIGWGVLSVVKGYTKRGAETVRAHVYLGGMLAGASVEQANRVAAFDVASGPREVIDSAIAHLHSAYGGSQRAMIVDAYSKGMKSNLPSWYQQVMARGGQATKAAPRRSDSEAHGDLGYDTYYAAFLREVKRLDGEPENDLHWIELVDDAGFKRAYAKGLDPRALAKFALKSGMPGPLDIA